MNINYMMPLLFMSFLFCLVSMLRGWVAFTFLGPGGSLSYILSMTAA